MDMLLSNDYAMFWTIFFVIISVGILGIITCLVFIAMYLKRMVYEIIYMNCVQREG